MSEDSSDIFIKFVLRDNLKQGPIEGESTADISKDDLFKGFHAGQMFEIDSFSFAVGISDDSEDHKPGDAAAHDRGGSGRAGGAPVRTAPAASALAGRHGGRPAGQQLGSYSAFRKGGSGMKYPVRVDPITITRPIDKSSPRLLQYCIDTTSFESVTVVKRKAAGTLLAGQPYLRLDFVGVLIRDVSWSNDEPVKETTKLISRAITVRYKPQLLQGTLGVAKIGFWSMLPWEKEYLL